MYDKVADVVLAPPVARASVDAVLLFDGVFLLRPGLAGAWDLRVFVSVGFDVALDRARVRDRTSSVSGAEVERRYRGRYLPSQRFYFETVRPVELADVVVYNDVPDSPTWVVRAG